jgi:hypothetical protein
MGMVLRSLEAADKGSTNDYNREPKAKPLLIEPPTKVFGRVWSIVANEHGEYIRGNTNSTILDNFVSNNTINETKGKRKFSVYHMRKFWSVNVAAGDDAECSPFCCGRFI